MQWKKAFRVPVFVLAGLLVSGVAWAGHQTYKGFNVVHVKVNGQELGGEVPAINFHGSTLMPVRAISEALGAKVSWNGDTQTVQVDTAGGAAAVVNGKAISLSTLNARLQEQFGKQMLTRMIEEELILQEAQKAGITFTAEEARAELERIRQEAGAQKLAEYLAQRNLTEAQYTDMIRYNTLATRIVSGLVGPQVTDAAVQKFYQENQLKLIYGKTQVRASHILVKTEAEATAVLGRLAKGEKFADLAVAVSVDPTAKQNQGDLGYFGAGTMVPAFEQAAFKLKVGELSPPVQSPFGWHIILMTDRKESGVVSEATALMNARKELVEQAARQAVGQWLQGVKAFAQIENSLESK